MTTTDDGFELAVQVTGPDGGSAPTLLLLPGQANSHHWWDGLRGVYGERFRVVTFDYRGTGGSRGPVGDWSTASFADDAAQVLRALGVGAGAGKASVYGTSMGGRVAQLLAVRHPDLVDAMVLACTSPGGRHAHERSQEVRRSLTEPDPARRLATLRELFYTDAWTRGSESNLFGDATQTAAESRAHLRASNRHDAWSDLPAITAPTLVLHGTADLMVPADNATILVDRIPGASLRLHEGGRHGFFEEFSRTVDPWVLSFLRQARPD